MVHLPAQLNIVGGGRKEAVLVSCTQNEVAWWKQLKCAYLSELIAYR